MPKAHDEVAPDTEPAARIRVISGGTVQQELDTFDERYLGDDVPDDGFVWIDLTNPDDAMLDAIRNARNLHPLLMRTVRVPQRQSSVSMFEGSAHLVAHFPIDVDRSIRPGRLEMILLERVLITMHGEDSLDDEDVLEYWKMSAAPWRSTIGAMLYALLSVSVARFGPLADHLDDKLDHLERVTINRTQKNIPKREDLYHLFELTEYVTDLHNMALPLKDVIHTLMHSDDWFSEPHASVWARSVHDDAVRLSNRLQAMRESGERLFDMVNSLITLQRTDVSKQLTIVATIFLPMSFIGTYFGQNLKYMTDAVAGPEAFFIWGVGVPLAALVVIVGIMWRFGAFR